MKKQMDKCFIKKYRVMAQSSDIILPGGSIYGPPGDNKYAQGVYLRLNKSIGCTYLHYLYEDLISKVKFSYSSNTDWQDLLMGANLIASCPIYKGGYGVLKATNQKIITAPFTMFPPSTRVERNVCGLRREHNIDNGYAVGTQGPGFRECIIFAGDVKDASFYKNMLYNRGIVCSSLYALREVVVPAQ